jgi:hypothetical protein
LDEQNIWILSNVQVPWSFPCQRIINHGAQCQQIYNCQWSFLRAPFSQVRAHLVEELNQLPHLNSIRSGCCMKNIIHLSKRARGNTLLNQVILLWSPNNGVSSMWRSLPRIGKIHFFTKMQGLYTQWKSKSHVFRVHTHKRVLARKHYKKLIL